MWLHHQNNYKFGTGANNILCFYSPSLKMQKPRHLLIPISLFTICVATLPILSSENLILPKFAILWNIQTADFRKLIHQTKIWICSRLRINAVIIPWAVFPMFTTNYKVINDCESHLFMFSYIIYLHYFLKVTTLQVWHMFDCGRKPSFGAGWWYDTAVSHT